MPFIQGELGEVIAGQKEGRRGDDAVTIYKSLGLAVQDLVRVRSPLNDVTLQGMYMTMC